MATRPTESQTLHDKIIQQAYDNLDKVGHDVYVNAGQQNNTNVGGEYPDIIITTKDDKAVKFIIEVETSDSINQSEAVTQWTKYSKLGGVFYLLLPKESRNLAEQICIQNNIKARYGTYSLDSQNNVQISYE